MLCKDHGADDDLKLLNLIESFCKTKVRQSINVNVQEAVASVVNKPQPQRINESNDSLFSNGTLISSPSFNQKASNKLIAEKK